MKTKQYTENLYNIDCLSEKGLRSIPDSSVSCVLADPPFQMTKNEWDILIPIDSFWKEIIRISKPNAAIIIFTKQPFTTYMINSNPNIFRYELIWVKEKPTKFFESEKRPLPIHENILIFCKNGYPTYFPQMENGIPYRKTVNNSRKSNNYGKNMFDKHTTKNQGSRYPTTILFFKRDHANIGIHPTQKPVDLYKWLIKSYTKKGDLIVDPFLGSGSSILACISLGRKYIGYEKDPEIFLIMNKRIERFIRDRSDTYKKIVKNNAKF